MRITGRVQAVRTDFNTNAGLAANLGGTICPTYVLFCDGKPCQDKKFSSLSRFTGMRSASSDQPKHVRNLTEGLVAERFDSPKTELLEIMIERMEWDSNPRYALTYASFQD